MTTTQSDKNSNSNNTNNTSNEEEPISKEIITEFKLKIKKIYQTFNYDDFMTINHCTSCYYGEEPINQKCYICSTCDPLKKRKICRYCYKKCHQKCRDTLPEIPENLNKYDKQLPQIFSCQCALFLKHNPESVIKNDIIPCTTMQLDRILKIIPCHCVQHDVLICCICAIVCHKDCTIKPETEIDDAFACNCESDYHTFFNEIALNFDIEKFIKMSTVDVWPIQILNILFSAKDTFAKMSKFFLKVLSNNIDFNNYPKNMTVIDKFESLILLFTKVFNRDFKTYYFHDEIIKTFPMDYLIITIRSINNSTNRNIIIKWRLMSIIFYVHLKKDFQDMKNFTSNDFLCGDILQRIIYKKIIKGNSMFNDNINHKYNIRSGLVGLKKFLLKEISNLLTTSLKYITFEESKQEIKLALKLIGFLLKKTLLDQKDLLTIINCLFEFHLHFYDYIASNKSKVYQLLDIFILIIKLSFMICISYNDLIVENFLDNNDTSQNFIQVKSVEGNKLFTMALKNCEIFSRHFNILIKPFQDKKGNEEKKREKNIRKHKLAMQSVNLNNPTKIKIPENDGLFQENIINMFNETLAIFSLVENCYKSQLEAISTNEIENYIKFCNNMENNKFYEIVEINNNKEHSNVLLNLKIVIEETYYALFNTSYVYQKEMEKKIRTRILNACDEILKNVKVFEEKSYYKKLINKQKENEKKMGGGEENEGEADADTYLYFLEESENIRRKILKDISFNLKFAKSPLFLLEEFRELIVNNFIMSNIDSTLMKGLYFLTNIHYPNIINAELVRLIFHIFGIFLLTKTGVKYILTGNNLQIMQRLINRFRYDGQNKNVIEVKDRSTYFNIGSIKIVIHYLNLLSQFIRIYNFKPFCNHKTLHKIHKNLLIHLKYYANVTDTEESQIEFKHQLKEGLEIFNNLSNFYRFDEYENIKLDIINLFQETPFNFLKNENIAKWFDRTIMDLENPAFIKRRRLDLNLYFQFLEVVTKNTFYVYYYDIYMQKLINSVIGFIDLENFYDIIIASSELMSFKQRTVLLKFIRIFYLIEILDPIEYLNKENLLTMKEYKLMIDNNLIKDEKITQNLVPEKNTKKIESIDIPKYVRKLEKIDNFILLINLYTKEIETFPDSVVKENNENILKFVTELIYGAQQISNSIYLNKDIINKLMPSFYKLVKSFLKKEKIIIQVLLDIENKKIITPANYDRLLEKTPIEYENLIKRDFNIFDKELLYKYIIESIFDIYKNTNLNKDMSLINFIKINENSNALNYPTFSLMKDKNFEFFYETEKYVENSNKNNLIDKITELKNIYIKDFTEINYTSFLGVLVSDSQDKKIDYVVKFIDLFSSFLNSSESINSRIYKIYLRIINKMLYYDREHIQKLLQKIFYDKYFFTNLDRELNYYITHSINTSKIYELNDICKEYSELLKLTINFIKLLTEGYNTFFHNIIFKGNLKNKEEENKQEENKKEENENKENKDNIENKENNENKENKDNKENKKDEKNSDTSSDDSKNDLLENVEITEDIIQKSIEQAVKKQLQKKREIRWVDANNTIYETIINNLKIIYHLMDLKTFQPLTEAPFDKLILLSTEFIDFIINYLKTKPEYNPIVDKKINNLFFASLNYNKGNIFKKGILSIFTIKKIDNTIALRKVIISYMKINFFRLLKAYLEKGDKKKFVNKLLENNLNTIDLFFEILYYFEEVISTLIQKNYKKYKVLLNMENDNEDYLKILINLYMFDDNFRNSMELKVVFQICIIIKLLEDIYNVNMLKDFFANEQITHENKNKKINKNSIKKQNSPTVNNNINQNTQTIQISQNQNNNINYNENFSPNDAVFREMNDNPYDRLNKYYNDKNKNEKKNDESKVNKDNENIYINMSKEKIIHSKFALVIYQFLDTLVCKVYIHSIKEESKNAQKNKQINNVSNEISQKIVNLKNNDKLLSNIKLNKNEDDEEEANTLHFEVYKENNIIMTLFVKSYLSFHLSEKTKTNFINTIDRSSIIEKYQSLISFSDYCLFEMIYNMKYINGKAIIKFFNGISLEKLQKINYVFIVIENIILIILYYRSHSKNLTDYENIDTSVKDSFILFIILLVKLVLIIFAYLAYFICDFTLLYEKNIIYGQNHSFIFLRSGETDQNIENTQIVNLFHNLTGESLIKVMSVINKNITTCQKIKNVIFDSILFNKDINIFFFSMILNILFILLEHPLILSVEFIFIINLSPSILQIFKKIFNKILILLAILLFTIIIIYFFTWIFILYMQNGSMDFGDVLEYETGSYIEEPFCHSSLQCFLILLDFGIRLRGKTADLFPNISYQYSKDIFVHKFFMEIFLFIALVIVANYGFAIIIDIINIIRDENNFYDNDKNNKCFICQLNRDGCIMKNIDFDKHVNYDHNIWNYVDFLIYLHLKDKKHFTKIENSVWEKLINKDYGWLPVDNVEIEDNERHDEN